MKVSELILQLQHCDPDKPVRVIGSEEDQDDWDCWDLHVDISEVQELDPFTHYVGLLVRPWGCEPCILEDEDDEAAKGR